MNISTKEYSKKSYSGSFTERLRVYYEVVRLKEILLIGGVTFIGIIFNPQPFQYEVFPVWMIIMLSSYCLLGHAFTANDWSGYEYDKNDINKVNRPLIKGDIDLVSLKILSISLLFISLLLALLVSYISAIIVATIVILNYMYSGQKIFLKSIPVVSTFIHSLGASLGFLLGYTYTGIIDSSGLYFSFYFGLLYAAGHLNHEVMDNDSDRKSMIQTTPTFLGKRKAIVGSFILFSLSFLYIIYLVSIDLLSDAIIYGVAVSYSLYTYFFISTLKKKLNYESMIWFRQKYRIIFLVWGIFLSINIVLNKF